MERVGLSIVAELRIVGGPRLISASCSVVSLDMKVYFNPHCLSRSRRRNGFQGFQQVVREI